MWFHSFFFNYFSTVRISFRFCFLFKSQNVPLKHIFRCASISNNYWINWAYIWDFNLTNVTCAGCVYACTPIYSDKSPFYDWISFGHGLVNINWMRHSCYEKRKIDIPFSVSLILHFFSPILCLSVSCRGALSNRKEEIVVDQISFGGISTSGASLLICNMYQLKLSIRWK